MVGTGQALLADLHVLNAIDLLNLAFGPSHWMHALPPTAVCI